MKLTMHELKLYVDEDYRENVLKAQHREIIKKSLSAQSIINKLKQEENNNGISR